MRGKGEWQPQIGRDLRAIEAGPQDPDRHLQPGAGNRLHRLVRFGRLEVADQLDDILGKLVDAALQVPAHGAGGDLIRPGRPAEAQLDPPRMQRGEGAELLGDQQRRVVRQHDAAGADPDRAGAGRDMGQRHRGGGAGDAGQIVVLGHPEAPVAERLDMPRQVERIAQRLTGIAAFGDRREIENGERNHRIIIAPPAANAKPFARPSLRPRAPRPPQTSPPQPRARNGEGI